MEIRVYPDEVLRQPTAPVEDIDELLRKTACEMLDLMHASNGVGLAAPQVGLSLRLVVANIPNEETGDLVLVNPEIVSVSGEMQESGEGCLSFPGLEGMVMRPLVVTARWYDLDGKKVEVEARDLYARVLAHETDHLDGVLFIDKASSASAVAMKSWLARMEREYRLRHGQG